MREEASIKAIYRYPVKGLSAEPLAKTRLDRGQTIVADRRYAIENGPSGFDPAAPSYLPKDRFLMLMKNEQLAQLRSTYDEAADILIIRAGGREVARGELAHTEGRAIIERFFAEFCGGALRGPPKMLRAAGHSFSDVARKVVSIINLASVAAIENAVGSPVHPLRFRGNLYVAAWPPWHEFMLVGHTIAVGPSARLKVIKRIERCAATNVDPETGIRDLTVPRTLAQVFGHIDCGVYAEVVTGGEIATGDLVRETESGAPQPV
jgi:uncharacterized protein YcbX